MRRLTTTAALLILVSTLACIDAQPAAAVTFSIDENFKGTDFNYSGFFPPDTMGSVGPDHIVELINGAYSVYNKSGVLQFRSDLDQFWGVAGEIPVGFSFDPRVIYDHDSERWFAAAVDNGGGPNSILLAVSISSDPLDGWNAFAIDSDAEDTRWADYPTLGLDRDGVYVAANMFPIGGGVDTDISIFSFQKDRLLSPFPSVNFHTEFQIVGPEVGFTVQPSVDFGPSDGSAALLARGFFDTGTLNRTDIINADGPGTAMLSPTTNIAIVDTETPPLAHQPSPGPDTVNTGDTRIGGNVFEQGTSLWATHTIDYGNRAAIRWYEVDENTNLVLQSGTIFDPDLDLYYPSIAVNEDGIAVIGFSGSSDTQAISTYAVVGETNAGATAFGEITLLKEGNGTWDALDGISRNRWGDYSATVLDPSDPNKFWTFQEFIDGDDNWAVQITSISTFDLAVLAGSFTWDQQNDGNWSTASNWDSGNVPNGPDASVMIDDDTNTDVVVTLNVPVTINTVTIETGDTLKISDARSLTVVGTSLENDGTIFFDAIDTNPSSTPSTADLVVDGNLTLTGTGKFMTGNTFNNRILGANPSGDTLTNGPGHTIEGAGQIGLDRLGVINQGLIHANQPIVMKIDPNSSGLVNESTGTLRASGQGGLLLRNGTFDNQGTIEALDESFVFFTATATVSNIVAGGDLLAGTWRAVDEGNGATIQIDIAADTVKRIRPGAEVTLSGSGSVFSVNGTPVDDSLVNNQGTLNIFDGRDFNTSGNLANSGTLNVGDPNSSVDSGSRLDVAGQYTQTSGATRLNSATLSTQTGAQFLGGALQGSGTIEGPVTFGSGVTVAPGFSTGILNFQSDTTFDGILEFELAGTLIDGVPPNASFINTSLDPLVTEIDQINVFATANLASSLTFDISLDGGFMPQAGDFFDVFTADTISGTPLFQFPMLAAGLVMTASTETLPDLLSGETRSAIRLTVNDVNPLIATGNQNDDQTSIVYDAGTGEILVDAPASIDLTSINIGSISGIFTGDPAQGLGGPFDIDTDDTLFKLDAAGFGSFSLGRVAQIGLAENAVLADLSVVGSLFGGGGLGDVDLMYVPAAMLAAGDADLDYDFDQFDLIAMAASGKYLLNDGNAAWSDGDFDGAPGGAPGTPPAGDGNVNQFDIITALLTGNYLQGDYRSLEVLGLGGASVEEIGLLSGGALDDEQLSIIYDPETGEIRVEAPTGMNLTSLNIASAASIFTGNSAINLSGLFDINWADTLFKLDVSSGFSSLSFGLVAQPGLTQEFLLSDLSVIGTTNSSSGLGTVDLIYLSGASTVPEPSTIVLCCLLALPAIPLSRRRRRRAA